MLLCWVRNLLPLAELEPPMKQRMKDSWARERGADWQSARIFGPIANRPHAYRHALTVIELLVTIGIVSILLALTVCGIQRLRESANRLQCQNNLRNLALAVHAYHAAHRALPPYASKSGEVFGGWFVFLLPYFGSDSIYQQLVANRQTVHGGIQVIATGTAMEGVPYVPFPSLLCPSDPTAPYHVQATTNYLANWYAWGSGHGPYGPPQRFDQMTDGLSNIVLFAEGYGNCDGLPRRALRSVYFHNFGITQQGKPSDDPSYLPDDYTMFQLQPAHCDKWRAQTPHSAMPTALADGSVRLVSPDISPATWKAVLKPRDGTPPGSDW